MTVRDAVGLLGGNTDFALIGARTGRMLYNSTKSKKARVEKYYNYDTTEKPFYADIEAMYDRIVKSKCNFIRPRICIYVSGE